MALTVTTITRRYTMVQPTGLLVQPMQHRRLARRRKADASTSSTDSATDSALASSTDTSTRTHTRKHHDHTRTRTRNIVTATSTDAAGMVSTSTSTAPSDASVRKAAAAQAAATQHRNTQIGIACGVVGGLLLVFGALGVLIWLRRRKEAKQRAEAAADASAAAREKEDEMEAVRLDDELYYRQQSSYGNKRHTRLVYGQSGRAEAKADVGHRGEAGWNYANYLVHGLENDEHDPPLYR